MRRIAFRRVLPIVQLAIAAGLLVLGEAQEQKLRADIREQQLARMGPPKPADGSQSGVEWDLLSLTHPYIPPATQLCWALNLPGMLLSIPVAILLGLAMDAAGMQEGSWLLYLAYAPGIALFWWLVGRWLDIRHGLIAPRRQPPAPDKAERRAHDMVMVFGVLAFLMGLLALSRGFRQYPLSAAGFVLWPVAVSVAYTFEMRRWRALARAAGGSTQS